MRASRDRGELPLGLQVGVGALVEGVEKLVPLIGMGAEQALLALIQLDLGCLDGSGHTPLLCDHGSNFSVHVMIALELSCDSPVFLGSGVVVHCGVHGVIGEAGKEPMGEFSLFVDGNMLGWEEFMPVDGLVNADGAQAIEAIQLNVGGKDVHGMIAIRDWDEEVKDIAFILFIPFGGLPSSFPLHIPSVSVFHPMLVGFFQASRICLTLCQVFTLLLEYFKLFLIVAADFLILVRNSSQSLCDEEEFLSPWCPVSFKSGTY